jgi:hypothetical protein
MVFPTKFIEVTLKKPDDFLKVKETLTRIGVASKKDNTLYQSCHILHKQGKYAICHFKQLFELDGRTTNFDETDQARTNSIANMLAQWGLVVLVDTQKSAAPVAQAGQVRVIPFREKAEWKLESKYSIGRKIQK